MNSEEKAQVIPEPINAWESNKQEVPQNHNDQPLYAAAGTSIDVPSSPEHEEEKEATVPNHKPSVPRFLLRVWQFFAAIGAFGFQFGATPVSKSYPMIDVY
jgi:hypothetical protein